MGNDSYKNLLNEKYRQTGSIRALDGYVSTDPTLARENAERDYRALADLIAGLDVRTVFDCGCGTGLQLLFLVKAHGIIPYGIDYNDVALHILRETVLPGFRNNFKQKDWTRDVIEVGEDLCILMMSLFRDDLESLRNIRLQSRYLVLRESPPDTPEDHAHWLEAAQGFVLDHLRRRDAGAQGHQYHLYRIIYGTNLRP